MGIRYEKDTILNWINEMGKFLRLLVNKRAGMEDKEADAVEVDATMGYIDFFGKSRQYFEQLSQADLLAFVKDLDPEQLRPLALLMMHDGFLQQENNLLEKAKFLLEHHMRSTGSFSFEDYGYLAAIDKALNQEKA